MALIWVLGAGRVTTIFEYIGTVTIRWQGQIHEFTIRSNRRTYFRAVFSQEYKLMCSRL
jgi:hypothetical protein